MASKTSIFKPIVLSVSILVSLIVVVVALWLYQALVSPLEAKFLQNALEESRLEIESKLNSKIEEGKAMAIALSNDKSIQGALLDGDREPILNQLTNIKAHFAEQSKYKNIGVQIIDGDNHSFIKSWNKDSFGEEIKHPMLTEMLKTAQVIGGIGVGAQGFGVLAFSPVIMNKKVLGAVVASGGIAAITKEMKKQGDDWVLLLDKKYLESRYHSIPKPMKDNQEVSGLLLAHNKWFDSDAVSFVNQMRDASTEGEKFAAKLIGSRILIDLPLYDEENKVAGRHIIIKDATDLIAAIFQAKTQVYTIVISIVFSLILIAIFILWMVRQKAIKPLNELVESIHQVVSTSQFNLSLPSRQLDEVGLVYDATTRLLSNLNSALAEANHVVGSIAKADFAQRVTGQYVGDLDKLKQGVNDSATSVSFMMDELGKVMKGLNEGKFDVRMDTQVPKAFRDLVETALNNIHQVIEDINHLAHQMKVGDFDARVNAPAAGDLLLMKDHFNDAMTHTANVIRSIVTVVEAQASGDLTKELPAGTYLGQFHDLKNAMSYSAKKVKESVIRAIDASNIVNEAASQVSQGSSDLSGRVQEQAASLEETSATMNEMASAVQANTANAKKVADLAHQVQHRAGAGVEVMQQTISAMQSIKDSSTKIADIVTIIDGIAFQTNLLALNAAVEAARAGEHGRGFAVVAGEVRALAQKSAEAAKDIKHLINDSVTRIETGTQLADKSGEMLSGITGSIEQVAEMIESIAKASNEQSEGIQQVHRTIADIDRVTQENAALVEETTAAAESLSTEANHLKENMSFFNTGIVSHAHYHAKHLAKLPVTHQTKTSNEWNSF